MSGGLNERVRGFFEEYVKRAMEFYTKRLGFRLAFGDKADPPNYAGFRRDAVELHNLLSTLDGRGEGRSHAAILDTRRQRDCPGSARLR